MLPQQAQGIRWVMWSPPTEETAAALGRVAEVDVSSERPSPHSNVGSLDLPSGGSPTRPPFPRLTRGPHVGLASVIGGPGSDTLASATDVRNHHSRELPSNSMYNASIARCFPGSITPCIRSQSQNVQNLGDGSAW